MSLIVKRNFNNIIETYCYDDKNPTIFGDKPSAIHFLQENGYKGLTNKEVEDKIIFEDINVIQNN